MAGWLAGGKRARKRVSRRLPSTPAHLTRGLSIPNERLRAAIYAYTYTHLCLHTCMRMSTSVHTCWDEWSEYLGPPLCAFSLDDLEI